MEKTIFKVAKMDCPAEEQLVRMNLEGVAGVRSLNFDIPQRVLIVYHTGNHQQIFKQLSGLKIGVSIIENLQVKDYSEVNKKYSERKILWLVLLINFFFFILELAAGFIAGSMGLMADSLDMFADSFIYGLALFAIGGTVARKKHVAKAAGYLQLGLVLIGLVEIVRRFAGFEPVPAFKMMISISVLALIGNVCCLYLLQKDRDKEAHVRASMICTSNDVIVNASVIASGILVYLTTSKYPDLIIGIIVFIIVGFGAFKMFRLSK